MAHFSTSPTVFVAGIDLTDRGNSQEVWVPLIIHHTACDTAPKLHPLYADTLSLNSPLPAHLSLSTSQTSAGSTLHSWITLNHHRRSSLSWERHKAPRTTAAWGAACHVSPSITSDSPARVSYAETGKKSTACFRYSYCTCVSMIALHMSCPWLLFVIFDSAFQLEGILGISQGLSSGVKQRLWILWGQVQDQMVTWDSPWVVPAVVSVWPTVSMIQLPFASTLHLCEDDLPAVSDSGFPPKSGPDPIHYQAHMWAI